MNVATLTDISKLISVKNKRLKHQTKQQNKNCRCNKKNKKKLYNNLKTTTTTTLTTVGKKIQNG